MITAVTVRKKRDPEGGWAHGWALEVEHTESEKPYRESIPFDPAVLVGRVCQLVLKLALERDL